MKHRSLTTRLILALAALSFAGCGKPAAPKAAAPVIESADQKVSYGIGYNLGSNMARDEAIKIDQTALVAGIADGMAKAKTRVSEADLETAFAGLQERAKVAMAATAEKQLAAGNDYLAKNKAHPGVTETASGLQYEVLVKGAGARPKATDTVKVHYHGTLVDGTVFDSSVVRKEPIEFAVTGVIQGWIEALQLMSVGDKWKLTIPPAIAYGARAKGDIPPNSVLIFEVELLEIK